MCLSYTTRLTFEHRDVSPFKCLPGPDPGLLSGDTWEFQQASTTVMGLFLSTHAALPPRGHSCHCRGSSRGLGPSLALSVPRCPLLDACFPASHPLSRHLALAAACAQALSPENPRPAVPHLLLASPSGPPLPAHAPEDPRPTAGPSPSAGSLCAWHEPCAVGMRASAQLCACAPEGHVQCFLSSVRRRTPVPRRYRPPGTGCYCLCPVRDRASADALNSRKTHRP